MGFFLNVNGSITSISFPHFHCFPLADFVLKYCQEYSFFSFNLGYKLSLREKKIGGPEHPLSDLGLITYRSYWKAAIVSCIRQRYGRRNITVKGWHSYFCLFKYSLFLLLIVRLVVRYIVAKMIESSTHVVKSISSFVVQAVSICILQQAFVSNTFIVFCGIASFLDAYLR